MNEIVLAAIIKDTENKLVFIGDKIRKTRMSKDMTQQDVAFYMKADKSTISAIESGRCHNITLKTLIRIAQVLSIDVEELIRA